MLHKNRLTEATKRVVVDNGLPTLRAEMLDT